MIHLVSRLLFGCALVLVSTSAYPHTFEVEGLLGERIQVQLQPMYSGSNLVGVQLYELWVEEDVGHAFLAKKSFYRYDTKQVIEDRDWYYLNGFLSEGSLEVEHKYETQYWTITPDLAAELDRAARLVADSKASLAALKGLYRSLARIPFTVKAGELEREGEQRTKWLAGLQRIDAVEFNLTKSSRYGNRFAANFDDLNPKARQP